MAKAPVSKSEFWIGTVLSVLTIMASILVARLPIIAEQEAARRAKAAEQLADLSSAVRNVSSQLRSHASMFVEVEACLEKNKKPRVCWQKDYDFDPQKSVEAWANLSSREAAIRPYLVTRDEVNTLAEIENIESNHSQGIRSMLPPASPDAANSISNKILQTEKELLDKYKSLESMVSERVREK